MVNHFGNWSEKGDDLDTRIERNFGMMRPEGYRNYPFNGIS